MPFSISGLGPSGPQTETRSLIASALVLALKWDADGVRSVTIAAPHGEARCFRIVQARHYRRLRAGSRLH